MNRNTEGVAPRRVPFARPTIGEEEIEAAARVLRSGWLTTGEEALAFEGEFARTVGVRHALAVNSATAGLHLAMEAVGVGPGDRVIVPSLTFTATAEVVRYLGGEVEFADIEADGLLVDPESVVRRAAEIRGRGERLAAIIPVHLGGQPCRIDRLREIAAAHGAVVVEDAAHAFPSSTPTGYAGALGDVGVFSFYANKTITTGEGGMVTTDRDEWADRIRTMRLHGIDRDAWSRYTVTDSATAGEAPHWYYEVVAPGFKYNLTDIAAAIGRVQLTRATELLKARRRIAHRYCDALRPSEAAGLIRLPREAPGHAWHLFVIRIARDSLTINRDRLVELLRERGVGTSVHYIPLHRMPYWRERYPAQVANLPRTDARFHEIVSLPISPSLSSSDQEYVIATLTELLERHRG
ncbi:MAG: DegT/DnrJ/EryC1/StrS aminotransferase family protein [Spirochaetales bacterium]|nr:DegT/DnrJ/EryC1/StrS aminotransferase family protein [Spirochaetales bacterium]